ncbi:MAG TPA: pantetheine-phosphate adenylyltransferase [Desulfotomaculum sp.]|nr:pantetheine-phosphate adenylyltransferase [Desulfotomaculum sp.]
MRIAVYPGSFDPLTNGHIDVVERAVKLFDLLIVAISRNASKKPLFTVAERLDILDQVLRPFNNVQVDSFEGLTVNYAKSKNAQAIIRGLRAVSDFENEFMMALINKKLTPDIETIFLTTRAEFAFISSSAVKEAAFFGGCVQELVPQYVMDKLFQKYHEIKAAGQEGW